MEQKELSEIKSRHCEGIDTLKNGDRESGEIDPWKCFEEAENDVGVLIEEIEKRNQPKGLVSLTPKTEEFLESLRSEAGVMLKAKDWVECLPEERRTDFPKEIRPDDLIVLEGYELNEDGSVSINFALFNEEKHGEMVRKKAAEWFGHDEPSRIKCKLLAD